MPITSGCRILENHDTLKKVINKILAALKLPSNEILFVNISFSNGQPAKSPYAGLQYIMKLRGEGKNKSSVIFYGYEDFEHLIKKPIAAVLNSPAVEYIKLPLKLENLHEAINRAISNRVNDKTLDNISKQKYIKEQKNKIRNLKHRADNIHATWQSYVNIAGEIFRDNPELYPESLFWYRLETIKTWENEYEALLPIVRSFKMQGSQYIKRYIEYVKKSIQLITNKSLTIEESIRRAEYVTKNIKKICDILSQVNHKG